MGSPAFLSPPSKKKKKKKGDQNHTPPPLIGACFLMQGAFSHSAGSGRPPLLCSRTWRPCHLCPHTVCDVLPSCICLPPLCDEGRDWHFYFRVPSMMPGSVSVGLKRTNKTWHVVSSSRTSLHFLTDSSKELEELRSAFARALEYLKQEVEERKWGPPPALSACASCSGRCTFSVRGHLPLNYFLISSASVLQGFSESGDPSCLIMQNWARIEVNVFDTLSVSSPFEGPLSDSVTEAESGSQVTV